MAFDKTPHNYVFKNIHTGLLFVEELRLTLKPGEERPFVGILKTGSERLASQRMLDIKDLGPAAISTPKIEIPAIQPREKKEIKVEPVAFNTPEEVLTSTVPAPSEPASEPAPEPSAEQPEDGRRRGRRRG